MQTPFSVLTELCARSDFSEPQVLFDPHTADDDFYVCTVTVYNWEDDCVWARSSPCRTKKLAKHCAADCLLRTVLMQDEDLPYEWPKELYLFLAEHGGHVERRYNELLNSWTVRGEIVGYKSTEHRATELCFAGQLLLAEFKRAKKAGL
jgi:hypothetical protein